ncbi:pentapeptide repeat-containing protein [Streptomyces sp. CB02115]|uniref:pentapeptide repeat-containing protein n=1 Tax=Streptomyces sp. CB02115 TaxID=1703939 RepID=UPI001F518504|nr:pentapeptide repeat-containing protein [Streptomyces sp. CB02115]
MENQAGCPGVDVHGQAACLAHLPDTDRAGYLASLTASSSIDHRGTPFTRTLLNQLLDALLDPGTGHPRLGTADFESATFEGDTDFKSTTFESYSNFRSATFEGDTDFRSATFNGDTHFESATFKGDTHFESAAFEGYARFISAAFEGYADFRLAVFKGGARFISAAFKGVTVFASAAFKGDAWFHEAVFEGATGFNFAGFEDDADFGLAAFKAATWFELAAFKGDVGFTSVVFEGEANFRLAKFEGGARFKSAIFKHTSEFGAATFKGDVGFESAVFERSVSLGPLACAGGVLLSGATFNSPVTLSFAAGRLECRRTRWSSTAEVRLRHASVDFAHAVFEYPLTIAAEADPFVLPDGQPVDEQAFAGLPCATVRITSLRGVDAAHLVLSDVDLASCLFTGTVHLDQLRLEGACSFAETPRGWHGRRRLRRRALWFTRRRTLAEEHHWRAAQPNSVQGWHSGAMSVGQVGPAQLAPVYRALRKAFEDGKNEPGAADFYYGEMEMRRHDRTGTPRAERGLLHGYWLLSGYGLRASRALGWLAAAMIVTVVLLMSFGLPPNSPKQEATGIVPPGGGTITFEIDKADPQNPTGDKFTGERFEKALNVTLNSVVFRSSGQDLTTTGTYTEMASRVAEPVLLGLAVLAIRNRVKR